MAGQLEIPFRFEIAQSGNQVQGFFFEGDRKLGSTSGSFADGHLKFGYDYLDTTLELYVEGDQLHGTYRLNRPNAPSMEILRQPFCAGARGSLGGTASFGKLGDAARSSGGEELPATRGPGNYSCGNRGRRFPARFCESTAIPGT